MTADRHPLHQRGDLVFQHGLGGFGELLQHFEAADGLDLFPLFTDCDAFFREGLRCPWRSGQYELNASRF